MATIHGLDRHAFAVDFNVDHLHKFFKRVNYLPEEGAFFKSGLKHLEGKYYIKSKLMTQLNVPLTIVSENLYECLINLF